MACTVEPSARILAKNDAKRNEKAPARTTKLGGNLEAIWEQFWA
jgi:hypothetical protein